MTIATEQRHLTDAEYMALPDGKRYEYVNGELIDMGNSGMEHGFIASFLNVQIGSYVLTQKLGVICDSSTAFTLQTGSKRSPDLSFISKERLQGLKRLPKGYFQGAPDLAVEVISHCDTYGEIHDNLTEYFENGCRLAWVIHPDGKYVLVYHQPKPDQLLKLSDRLEGEDLLPGFSLAIADLFAELDF
jgi:Uma2 family endonuclease